MNEWKDLEIGNLPPDILTGEYRVVCKVHSKEDWSESNTWYDDRLQVLRNLQEEKILYRYIRPVNTPTHEEILKNWWFDPVLNDGRWIKIVGYEDKRYIVIRGIADIVYCSKDWFEGRKFAEFPPE